MTGVVLVCSILVGAPAGAADAASEAGNDLAERVELTELRTQNVKHFLEADGSRTAEVFAQPVHYRTESGAWRESDPNLVGSNTDAFAYTNARGGFDVQFAASPASDALVLMRSEDALLSFAAPQANDSASAVVDDNTITYEDA